MTDDPKHAAELDSLLDEISYQVTAARTAGAADPDALRAVLKRIRSLTANADSLAVTLLARRGRDS